MDGVMASFGDMSKIFFGDFPQKKRRSWGERGWRIVEPAQQPSLLPSCDWMPDSFLAVKDGEVLISLIHARNPGNGAWKRLLSNLKAHGIRKVTVVCPLPHMERVLVATGFKGPFQHGRTFMDRFDYWIREFKA
jgi:hypothetical protein